MRRLLKIKLAMAVCCGDACSVMNQKQMFYSSEMSLAAENLRKMAQMQSDAGMHDLARSSIKDAAAREHAKDYYDNDPTKNIRDAYDYGERRASRESFEEMDDGKEKYTVEGEEF